MRNVALSKLTRNVGRSGTPERLNYRTRLARWMRVRPLAGNAGSVYVGDASVSSSDPGLEAGESLVLRGDPFLNLFDIFVDADRNGDGVEVRYIGYG